MRIALCLFCLFLSTLNCNAGETGNEADDRARQELGPDGLPKYKHIYSDGLYSTVTAMNTFYIEPDELKIIKKGKLKVPGFKRDVPIYSVVQKEPAPLVVVLMGMDGKVDGPWGDLFPYWYSKAGYHVLTFDSPFTAGFADIAGKGVAGNFDAEGDQIASIIQAFITTGEAKDKVRTVGVVGMSFGASHVLMLGVKAKAGKLPFELSGCLALSPPIKLKSSAITVDRFYKEDRWNTTMVDLGKKFGSHVPVKEGEKIPFTTADLRAAVGYAFHDGLAEIVDKNDRAFKLKVLPKDDDPDFRRAHAEATGFGRFVEEFSYPFWQKQGVVRTPDELWSMSDVAKLLPALPDFADVIVTENDPFNLPEELNEAKAADTRKILTVLPNGGHLGYIAADWMLEKALKIFSKQPTK